MSRRRSGWFVSMMTGAAGEGKTLSVVLGGSEKSMPELLWIQTAETVESEQQLSFMKFVRSEVWIGGWCVVFYFSTCDNCEWEFMYICWLVKNVKNRRMHVYIFIAIAASLSHRSIVSELNITMSAFKISHTRSARVTSWKSGESEEQSENFIPTFLCSIYIFECDALTALGISWAFAWQPTNWHENLKSVSIYIKLYRWKALKCSCLKQIITSFILNTQISQNIHIKLIHTLYRLN